MIYVTGDMHGDPTRFQDKALKKLKKRDTLLICGDFGFLWDGTRAEKRMVKKIGKKKYKIAFVEGANENYDLLEQYPVVSFCGGQARQISGNLYQLMRGNVYFMENHSIFAFGGGESREIEMKSAQGKWFEQELPSSQEFTDAADSLERFGREVDYIVTHEAPSKIKSFLSMQDADEHNKLNFFLETVSSTCKFQRWFFGCYHVDKPIGNSFVAVFHNVLPLK